MNSPAEHHYRGISHVLGEYLIGLLTLPCITVLNAHVQADKVEKLGTMVNHPYMVGGKWRATIGGYVHEVYRAFVEMEEVERKGNKEIEAVYYWQTIQDTEWPFLISVMNRKGGYWGNYVEPNYEGLLKRRGFLKKKKKQKKR